MIYAVFVGATAPISDEISKIAKGRTDLRLIAPAVRKGEFGLNGNSIEVAFNAAIGVLRGAKIEQEKCRLVIITFRSSDFNAVTKLMSAFGASAWIEFIGNDNVHKPSKLRGEVEEALGQLPPLLHEISSEVFGRRKTSPLCLPLKNFTAPISADLKRLWYSRDVKEVKEKISKLRAEFYQRRRLSGKSFVDDRGLLFSPSADGECHGVAHPTGRSNKTFIRGKFRYGASLFPGFHYDVRDERGRNVQVKLTDAELGVRDLSSEKRAYINIHPNDVVLPRK
jgi:hypothetical protein